MMTTISNSALAWLLTYAIHSTVLLGLAWLVSRRAATSPAARDFMWKVALVGGIVTSTLQLQMDVRPTGSLALPWASARATSSDIQLAKHGDSPASDEPTVAPGATKAPAGDSRQRMTPTDAADSPALKGGAGGFSARMAATSGRVTSGMIAVWAWGAAALMLSIGYLARRLILVGRLGDRRAVIDGPLPEMLETLRSSSKHRGRVRLTSSAAISSPVALGLREICVPDAALTDLDADQQRGLLAHELAHLSRRDPLWLDGVSLIERVFFFQPLNRLARRELQLAAEYLCDDWAAARTGSGVPLARCLARVAEWIQASPLGVPVAGMAEQRSQLVSRIARLIEGRAAKSPVPRFVLAGAALVCLAVIVAAAPGVQGPVVAGGVQTAGAPSPVVAPNIVQKITGRLMRPPRSAGVARGVAPTSGVTRNVPPAAGSLGGVPGPAVRRAQEDPADTAVVRALIELLKDTDAGVRKAAASSLGNLASHLAVPALIAVLADHDRDVRAAAANALGDIHDDRAIGPLSELISDPSSDVREQALDALSNFARDVHAAPVLPALRDARADVRQKAANLLGEIGDRSAVSPLSGLLKDTSPEVREAALHALAQIKDPAVASAVAGALKDEYADVRHAALDALREMKVPITERTILDMLADPSADVRQAAIQFVSDRPFPDAVPVLKRLLDDPASDVRVDAVSALGEIGDPAARDALRAALKSKDAKVRQRAAEVLGARG